jgi:hypothetical protein
MDLNCLLHRYQTALMASEASPAGARRDALAKTLPELRARIAHRQRELGGTFSLVGGAR